MPWWDHGQIIAWLRRVIRGRVPPAAGRRDRFRLCCPPRNWWPAWVILLAMEEQTGNG